MTRDPRDETLDTIQEIADLLAVAYQIPEDARNYLGIIEALARHRSNPSVVDTKLTQLRAKTNRAHG